jgi:cephalosporin hydroxylase
MFAPRDLLAQCGGFDESFAMAGGGYANLELYERLGSSPDTTVVSILGEGSFHQLHGGTTTNQPDPVERRNRVFGYSQHYAELRGRPFRGPGKPIHYVGRFHTPAARRTKGRRLSGAAFAEAAAPGGVDGPPTTPVPVPQELRVSFTEAVWRNLPWQQTTWLGQRVATAPTDLVAYQELVAKVRPDWIVEVGAGDGGRSLFLASMCDLVDHGSVVTVGDPEGERPEHPRLRHVAGRPHDADVVAAVRALTGEAPHGLVVLGARADQHTTAQQFAAYAPLVRAGSYVVVTDTVVNGHPVWPGFGNGPAEAVKQILSRHGDFVPDPSVERWSLSFDPGGFLLRTR